MVIVDQPSKHSLPFTATKEEDLSDNPFGIHVPLLESGERAKIETAVRCFQWTQKGGLGSVSIIHQCSAFYLQNFGPA